MKNKVLGQFSIIMLTVCGMAQAITVDVPDWMNQVESILVHVTDIAQSFDHDALFYQRYIHKLNELIGAFDTADRERQQLFEALTMQINQLMHNTMQCHEDKLNADNANRAIIEDLQAQLAALRDAAEQERNLLNNEIARINTELESARQAYATLMSMDETAAEALIYELMNIKRGYSAMIEQRNNFIATLDRFINRASAHLELDGKYINQHGYVGN